MVCVGKLGMACHVMCQYVILVCQYVMQCVGMSCIVLVYHVLFSMSQCVVVMCAVEHNILVILLFSVWQYIGELTVAKQCTVVITTHYIDEARRANMVSQDMFSNLLYIN